MATGERSDHGARWDQLSPEDAGGIVATRRHAREAEAAKRARHWHHAKWIAINVALIAFTGWLYAAFLIPRFIVGDTAATRVAPNTWIADRPGQSPAGDTKDRVNPDRGENHRRRIPSERQPTTADERAILERVHTAKANGRLRCIGGTPFEIIERNGVTHVEQIGRSHHATCR